MKTGSAKQTRHEGEMCQCNIVYEGVRVRHEMLNKCIKFNVIVKRREIGRKKERE